MLNIEILLSTVTGLFSQNELNQATERACELFGEETAR